MADADDVQDKAAEVAASGISSTTVADTSVTAQDPEKLLNVADRLSSKSAAVGRSRGILFTKLQPPGAT